jgi:hypothetical protein
VTFTIFSTPRPGGATVVDAAGVFDHKVTVPADLEPGAHRLVATGRAFDGTDVSVEVPITATAAPESAGSSAPPAATLAATGGSAVALGLVGGASVVVGAAAVAVTRRRLRSV